MKALVVHPRFLPLGGAERVGLSVIGALAGMDHTEVTVLSLTSREDFVRHADASFAELVSSERVRWSMVQLPSFLDRSAFALLETALVHRRARRVARSFDVCVSTYNEEDFGVRGIQYVHVPLLANRELLHRYEIVPSTSALHNRPIAVWLYDKLVRLISGRRSDGFRRNVTLVNSSFTAALVREAYGIESRIVYPPVKIARAEQSPSKEPGLICYVGRISADKHLDKLIDHFKAIHDVWPDSRLTIAGIAVSEEYLDTLLDAIGAYSLPAEVLTNLSDEQVAGLLARSEYFINPKPYEHFGISVVEAINAGCVPFVFDGGGVTEIVPHSELRFKSTDELVTKIMTLVEDGDLAQRLLSSLRSNVRRFTEEEFVRQIRGIVAEFGSSPG